MISGLKIFNYNNNNIIFLQAVLNFQVLLIKKKHTHARVQTFFASLKIKNITSNLKNKLIVLILTAPGGF